MKGNRVICGMDGLEKSTSKDEGKGESEEAAVGIESDGRRKEIADKHRALAEKLRPFLCLYERKTPVERESYLSIGAFLVVKKQLLHIQQ